MLFILSEAYITGESNSKSYVHLFDLQNEILLLATMIGYYAYPWIQIFFYENISKQGL